MTEQKSEPLASDFFAYCQANPSLRFWQALRSWSGHHFICVGPLPPHDSDATFVDTFYWTDKMSNERPLDETSRTRRGGPTIDLEAILEHVEKEEKYSLGFPDCDACIENQKALIAEVERLRALASEIAYMSGTENHDHELCHAIADGGMLRGRG